MNLQFRLIEERERLGLNQEQMAEAGGMKKRAYCYYESGERVPDAEYLFGISKLGADVQYIVTGQRQGHGIGDSAVHQAVLDAVDLLSLDKKVDAQQLAKAVVKLCVRSAVEAPEPSGLKISVKHNRGQVVEGGQTNHGPLIFGKTVVKKP